MKCFAKIRLINFCGETSKNVGIGLIINQPLNILIFQQNCVDKLYRSYNNSYYLSDSFIYLLLNIVHS